MSEDNKFVEVLHAYTVHDAIRDGEKVNVDTIGKVIEQPDIRKEAGITWPVVISNLAYGVIKGSYNGARHEEQERDSQEVLEGEGQSISGRLWDVLFVARHTTIAKMVRENDHFGELTVQFAVREPRNGNQDYVTVQRDVKFFVSVDFWNEEHGCFSIYLPEEY